MSELKIPMSERELRNAEVCRRAATESMVLLENNGALPLETKTLALFGSGAVRTVRGGTGSGDPFNGGLSGGGDALVNQSERYHINFMDAAIAEGISVVNEQSLREFAKGYDAAQLAGANNPMITFAYPEFAPTSEEIKAASKKSDTAVYVLARNAGEGADRSMTKKVKIGDEMVELGDYELSDTEKRVLKEVSESFEHTVLVLNIGGVIDMKYIKGLSGIGAVIFCGQPGQEAGRSILDVLYGRVNPSGKTTATWAENYSDYPAHETFAMNDGNVDVERYTEGIFVGYRWFDTFGKKPIYPFGYGKSYTHFDISDALVRQQGEWTEVSVRVTNVGSRAGKEVVQLYLSEPQVELQKPIKRLVSFKKTKLLDPGESVRVELKFRMRDCASFFEDRAEYALEQGDYLLLFGNSSVALAPAAVLGLGARVVTEKVHNEYPISEDMREIIAPPRAKLDSQGAPRIELDPKSFALVDHSSKYHDQKVETYTSDKEYAAKVDYESVKNVLSDGVTLKDVYDGKATLEQLVARMSPEELAIFNCGTGWGVANEDSPIVGGSSATVAGAAGETVNTLFDKYGIPTMVLADGPGGVRVTQEFEATNVETGEKETRHQYCTAWPVGWLLAQSFDPEVLKMVGHGMAEECREIGVTILLGPGMNIHRDPLCGRNFEYYAEDPLVAGVMAAAMTRGLQSVPGVGACVKHYAANNQESNRNAVDTIVSERTLREIYLKGFEIAVRTAQPMSIMTSYNKINGVPTADSFDLCTDIARGEWGFRGLIMTDWNGGSSTPSISMHAGNDMIMPGGVDRVRNILCAVYGLEYIPPEPFWKKLIPEGVSFEEFMEDMHKKIESGEMEMPKMPKMPTTTEIDFAAEFAEKLAGEKVGKPSICLGDLQRCAMNNLFCTMHSLGMEQAYGVDVGCYADGMELDEII